MTPPIGLPIAGAMSAVLIVVSQRYGLNGLWVSCVLAGLFLTMLGLFRLGRYISFIPSPVITGFTSGQLIRRQIGNTCMKDRP